MILTSDARSVQIIAFGVSIRALVKIAIRFCLVTIKTFTHHLINRKRFRLSNHTRLQGSGVHAILKPMAKPIHQKQVNREAVRILAIEHGLKKASELSGVNYETVRKWSQRGHWNGNVSDSRAVVPLVPIADRVASEHAKLKARSRVGLARYAAEASEDAAKHKNKLKIARAVRDVAAVHSSLWPEDHNERGIVNLNVLAGGRAAIQINDRGAEHSSAISE